MPLPAPPSSGLACAQLYGLIRDSAGATTCELCAANVNSADANTPLQVCASCDGSVAACKACMPPTSDTFYVLDARNG